MNGKWVFVIAMMLGSASTGAQQSTSKSFLYDMRIIVAVNGEETSISRIVSTQGVSRHVYALLGPDPDKSPGIQIDAAAYDVQQASGSSAVMMKLTLSKPYSNGDMQVFATPTVVASEGHVSYVQVDNITISIWVTRSRVSAAAPAA
jgi:hypothetical protein